jgi:hypothetical protein
MRKTFVIAFAGAMLIGGAAFAQNGTQSGTSRPMSGPNSNCNTTGAAGGNPATNNTGLSNCGISTPRGSQPAMKYNGPGQPPSGTSSNASDNGPTSSGNAGSMVTGSP